MFFYFDGYDLVTCDTAERAKAEAERALDEFRECADEGWDELSLQVCWGKVHALTAAISSRPATGSDLLYDPAITTIEERGLVPCDLEVLGDE